MCRVKFKEYDDVTKKLQLTRRKIEEAQRLIRNADISGKKVSISFSGGKDSMAAMLLSISCGVYPEVVWFNSGYEYPETEPYIRNVCNQYSLQLRVITPRIDPLRAKIEAGFFDLQEIQKKNKEILSAWHDTNQEYDVVITGMRMQESKVRRMTIAKNGQYFYNKSYKSFALYPVAKFTAREIFGTIAYFNETYHPLYDKAKTIEERDWLRVNWYILTAAERGYYVFLKREYREQFNLLSKYLPEIRSYV